MIDKRQAIDEACFLVEGHYNGALSDLTQQTLKVMEDLECATMEIEKFKNKVFFRTNEQPIEVEGEIQMVSNDFHDPSYHPSRHPKVGELEHSIVEHIE